NAGACRLVGDGRRLDQLPGRRSHQQVDDQVVELEGHRALVLEDHRRAEDLLVERLRALRVLNEEGDCADARQLAHRACSSNCGRSSVISNHGAFEPTKMCFVGCMLGGSTSEPSATCTNSPSRTTE